MQEVIVGKNTFLEYAEDSDMMVNLEHDVMRRRSRSFSDSGIAYGDEEEFCQTGNCTPIARCKNNSSEGSTAAESFPGTPAELSEEFSSADDAPTVLPAAQQQAATPAPYMIAPQMGPQMYMLAVGPDGSQVLTPVMQAALPMWGHMNQQVQVAPQMAMPQQQNMAVPSFMKPIVSVEKQGSADSLEARAAALNAQAAEAAIAAKRAKAAAVAARKRLGSDHSDWQAARLAQTSVRRERTFSMASASTAAFTCDVTGMASSDTESHESDERTTLMFRNLPNSYNRAALLNMLDAEGFAGQYTFVYLPTDFKNFAGFGYAFIGFASHKQAEHAKRHFQGFTKWKVPSQKTCDVAWSGEVQGLEAYIDKYRNSPVMHDSVPDEYKPALFVNGMRIPFPAPTKRIRPPRVRHMAHMAA